MSYDLSKIPAGYLSHPHKPYVDHVGRMMESFDDGHFKKTALYHDLLKLASKFQAYINYNPATEMKRPPKTTHALESAFVYYLHHKEPSARFLAAFFAIAHHHGALPDIGGGIGRIMLKKARQIRSSAESIREVLFLIDGDEWDGKTTRMQFFLEQMKDRLEEFYGYENALMFRRLFSRLVLADKYEAVFDAPRVDLEPFGQAEIDAHLQSIQSYIEKRSASVEPQMADYRRRVREAVMESYRRRPHSRHYIIKAPTGAGKTLLALELALRIAAQKGARRIITALPFTSIIDQTTRVYEEILGAERVLKYHHLTSYKNDDEKSQQLSTKIFAADVWQSPFVVTTFNQLFYAIFSNHNRDMLRLETLRGSVVILDEIQAISRVLWRDLYKSLDLYAKEYDITFIFMSATMPDLSPYLGEVAELSREWFFTERKPRYRLRYEPQIDTIEALAKKVQERRGDSTLCVLNTIAKAKTLYRQLPGAEGEEKFLLTTHQIPKHRKAIIAQIARRLSAGEPLTLVATQLIEAGVDLDFAGGFREFAPFASIIQSAGRINREGRREGAELVVTNLLSLDGGGAALYHPYTTTDLQKTQVENILTPSPQETELPGDIKNYFKNVANGTNWADLLGPFKRLEFERMWKNFQDHFMPRTGHKVSLVVQTDGFVFERDYEEERMRIESEIDDPFERRAHLRELEKVVAEYTIEVSEWVLEKILKSNVDFRFGRYILPEGALEYTPYRGLDLPDEEELLCS